MLTLLGYGSGHGQLKKRKKAHRELERRPIPLSPIQQMKDSAGMPDMPNAEFVAWFKKLMGVFKNIHLVNDGVLEDDTLYPVDKVITSTTPQNDPPSAA